MRAVMRLTVALALVAAVVLGAASSASAETKTRTDRRGDAPANIDLLRVRYHYADEIAQAVHIRNLDFHANVFMFIGPRNSFPKYEARVWKDGGDVHRRLYAMTSEGPGEAIPCRAMAAVWRPEASRVSVVVPRTCIDLPRIAYMRAETVRDRDLADPDVFDQAKRVTLTQRG